MRKPLNLGLELVSVALKNPPVCDGCGGSNGQAGPKFAPISGREGPRRYRAWRLTVDGASRYFCTACASTMANNARPVTANDSRPENFSTNCPDCTAYFVAPNKTRLAQALAEHRAATGCEKARIENRESRIEQDPMQGRAYCGIWPTADRRPPTADPKAAKPKSFNCPGCSKYFEAPTQEQIGAAFKAHIDEGRCNGQPNPEPACPDCENIKFDSDVQARIDAQIKELNETIAIRDRVLAPAKCWNLPTWMTRAGLWATIRTYPAKDDRYRVYLRIPDDRARRDHLQRDFWDMLDELCPNGSRAFVGTLDDPIEAGGLMAGFICEDNLNGPPWPIADAFSFAENAAETIRAYESGPGPAIAEAAPTKKRHNPPPADREPRPVSRVTPDDRMTIGGKS